MDTVLHDLRYALRSLRKSPGFTLVAVLTLALGIGATTTIFSVVNAVVLRPLPFHEPGRLVRLWETNPHTGNFSVSDATYLDFQARNRAFVRVAAFSETRRSVVLTGGCAPQAGSCDPERLPSAAVTATLFPLLGVRAALGRTFSADEDRPGGDTRVVVVSHELWQRRFAADPALVGRTLTLDGESVRVIGIMPERFEFPTPAAVWMPLAPDPTRDRDEHDLAVIARLKPGVTLEQASADLNDVASQLGQQYPRTNAGWGVHLTSLSDWLIGPQLRRAVFVLLGAVGLLLLIACVNVANLLIARSTAREAEIGIRAALGASRARLTRQLLTETMVLGLLGAGTGLGIAVWAVELLRIVGPGDIARLSEVRIDTHVLGFTLMVTLGTSLIVGLVPAVRVSRVDLHETLKRGARGWMAGSRRFIRNALVTAEVALAMMLLIGAGLLMGSFVRLQAVNAGFDATHVLTVPLQLPEGRYREERREAFFQEVLTRITSLPGVTSAGATSTNPLRQWGYTNDVTPQDRAAETPPSGFMQAGWRSVTPGFFRAMSIPLLRGRTFSRAAEAGDRASVVISETLARRLWPGQNPVGKRLFWGGTTGTPRTVIGVVGDIRDVQLDADPAPLMFLRYSDVPIPGMTLIIRTAGDPTRVAGAVRREIRAVDHELPIPSIRPLHENRAEAVSGPRFRMLVMALFAAAALLLAAVGIYGVMAFAVAHRTREIGIRMALGAELRDVVGLVLRHGLELTLAGVVIGIAGALALTRVLSSLLFDVSATDPLTFVGVSVLLVVVAVIASYFPARRAARVNPVIAMRSE